MTIKEIAERRDLIKGYMTSRIESTVNPMRAAHDELFKLRNDVLQAIANGATNPEGLAAAALEPIKIGSSDWE